MTESPDVDQAQWRGPDEHYDPTTSPTQMVDALTIDRRLQGVVRADDTCSFCYRPVTRANEENYWTWCPHCNRAMHVLDAVVPISYATEGGLWPLIGAMKGRYPDLGVRRDLEGPLASTVRLFLNHHSACIQRHHGPVDVATWIPANAEHDDHNRRILVDYWRKPGHLWREVLRQAPQRDGKGYASDAFEAVYPVDGQRVLLFDDAWRRGGTMHSAAATLYRAGAQRVVGVVLGRIVRGGELVRPIASSPWHLERCVLCHPDPRAA